MTVYEELVGQSAAIAEIQRAAAAARLSDTHTGISDNSDTSGTPSPAPIADEGSVSAMTHAWLFTGPPGSGRSLAAKVFAAALQCTGSVPGCGECAPCKAVMADNHPDITLVSTDLVTIKAEEVREFVAQSYVAPSTGKYRIFIVEDADRMQTRTTNVLLKAIEEPAPRTVWMLCTAAVADVLPTIRSRTRNINLVTPSATDVATLLVSRDGVAPEKALVAAQAAQSHIGVARALATDPSAAALRSNTLAALTAIHGVGDAALAAQMLLDADAMYLDPQAAFDGTKGNGTKGKGAGASKSSKSAKHGDAPDISAMLEAEQEKRMAALGLDPSAKIPAAVKNQIRLEADNLKRRQTRMQRDMLDRELIYIQSFFRDVLTIQLHADVAVINSDVIDEIRQYAEKSTAEQTIARMDAFDQARKRLRGNVTPILALEAALVTLVQ